MRIYTVFKEEMVDNLNTNEFHREVTVERSFMFKVRAERKVVKLKEEFPDSDFYMTETTLEVSEY